LINDGKSKPTRDGIGQFCQGNMLRDCSDLGASNRKLLSFKNMFRELLEDDFFIMMPSLLFNKCVLKIVGDALSSNLISQVFLLPHDSDLSTRSQHLSRQSMASFHGHILLQPC
jgi:hypothetical protein